MERSAKNKMLGARIRQAREAKGWSQDALADELDTEQATVARWESGTFPKRIGLPKIAAALERSVEWFFEEPAADLEAIKRRLAILEERESNLVASDIIPPKLWSAWMNAEKEKWRRDIALFFLTGNPDEMTEAVSVEFRQRLLKALRFHKMMPTVKTRAPKK